MSDPFPGYAVLAKHDTPSWNAITRRVVGERLAMGDRTDALSERQRQTLRAVIDRVVPQPDGRPPVNAAALVLQKIAEASSDGYRHHALPPVAECWARGLDGFGGPASPRGYVRLEADERDPWEAAEQGDGAAVPARVRNAHIV